MPTLRVGAASAVVDGKVYVMGGVTKSDYSNKVEQLDSATGKWTTRAPMPVARSEAGAVAVGGVIYVFGGVNGDGALSRVDVYNPTTNTWTEGPSLPVPVWDCMVAAVGQKVYVIGGVPATGNQSEPARTVQVSGLSTNTWSIGPQLPFGLHGAAVAVVQDRVYVIGGRSGTGDETSSGIARMLILDPTKDAWGEGAPLGSGRAGLQAAVAKGKIVVTGGSGAGTVMTSVDSYDPAADMWSQIYDPATSGQSSDQPVALKPPVTGHCMAAVGDRAYVIGGTSSSLASGITGLVQGIIIP